MASANVNLNITATTKAAQAAITGLGSALGNLKMLAGAAVAVLGAREVVNFFSDAKNAALEEEKAVRSLNAALVLSGTYTRETSAAMQTFADRLEVATGISGEAVMKQLAFATSLGVTGDNATRVVEAAANLAAVTNLSLDSATEAVTKTMNGQSSALDRLIPGMSELTEEQKKSGEGLKILETRFGGAASAMLGPFSSATLSVDKGFGDLQKSVGKIITQNPLFIAAIKKAGEFLQKLTDFVSNNQGAITATVNTMIEMALRAVPYLVKALQTVLTVMSILVEGWNLLRSAIVEAATNVAKFILAIGPVKAVVNEIADVFRFMGKEILNAIQFALDLTNKIPFAGRAFDKLGINVDRLQDTIDGLGRSLEASVGQDITADLVAGLEFANSAANTVSETTVSMLDGATAGLQRLSDGAVELADGIGKIGSSPVNSTDPGIANVPQIEPSWFDGFFKTLTEGLAEGIKDLTSGKDGVVNLFKKGATMAVDTFFPGMGAAAGELLGILSQGPDKVREMIDQFFQAIPDVVIAIIEAIPAVIEGIIDNLPPLIDALVEAIPRVIDTLVERAPEIIRRLADRAPDIISKLVELSPQLMTALAAQSPVIAGALIKEMPNIIATFIKLMPTMISAMAKGVGEALSNLGGVLSESFKALVGNLPSTILNALSEGIRGIFGGITGIGKGYSFADKAGGVLSTYGKGLAAFATGGASLLFAEGGMVPGGFPNDTFAMPYAQSGELVVPRGTTGNLFSLIDNLTRERQEGTSGGGGKAQSQNLTINLSVGERELATVLLDLNRQGFRTA